MQQMNTCTGGLILLLAVALIVVLSVTGCGGGGGTSSVQLATTGWKQVDATYVGRSRCTDCHASTNDQYATQAHGQDFHVAHGQDLISGMGGRCAACHVTGFGELTGGKGDGSTPNLEGIGCESCHGPGSKHAATMSKDQITRLPVSEKTCWSCHVTAYKELDAPVAAVNAAKLRETVPNKVAVHHPQALFLNGVKAYETAPMPSPHKSIPNNCVACHLKPGALGPNGKFDHTGASLQPDMDMTQAACATCHGGRNETLIQSGVKEKLIALIGEDPAHPGEPDPNLAGGALAAFATAHNIVLGTNAAPDDPNVIAYKKARYNADFVLADASLGVHNPGLAQKLLADAAAALK